MVTKGEGGGGGINQKFGINIYTLLYIKQIINKDLLYSTEDNTQHLVITQNGKESEKEKEYIYIYIYIYETESLYCIPESLEISYTSIMKKEKMTMEVRELLQQDNDSTTCQQLLDEVNVIIQEKLLAL